jgi:glycerol-3-phosphate O-acyltransferase
MFGTVEIPVWLLWVAGLLAAIATLDRIIGPGLRWFFRRRMERALARVNSRLERKIEPFKLARRQDMIVRLLYDQRVLEAVSDHAADTRVPGSVAFEEARRYAREIVPGFSATLYFGFATRAAKAFSRMLYRVRVGKVDAALAHIDPKATVIFVMNHRSNMDYVLVTWLVADRSAISYAVGEWARIWPLSSMIRAMGAYFIRRGSRNALYRKVLARYVQMATADGTTQAIFPEGGLSLDGRVGSAKMGLLSYIVQGFEPSGRDVVFVPVGLGYDRVLEDRVLIAAAAEGGRRFRNRPLRVVVYALRMLWNRFRGRFKGFGTAAAGFGAPVSLRDFLAAGNTVETLGETLMAQIAAVVPVLPVPLVAAALGDGVASRESLRLRVEVLIAGLVAAGAVLKLPPQGIETTLDEGLAPLIARGLVSADLQPLASGREVLRFYAASVPLQAPDAAVPQT